MPRSKKSSRHGFHVRWRTRRNFETSANITYDSVDDDDIRVFYKGDSNSEEECVDWTAFSQSPTLRAQTLQYMMNPVHLARMIHSDDVSLSDLRKLTPHVFTAPDGVKFVSCNTEKRFTLVAYIQVGQVYYVGITKMTKDCNDLSPPSVIQRVLLEQTALTRLYRKPIEVFLADPKKVSMLVYLQVK